MSIPERKHEMAITEVNLANLGSVIVPTKTSDSMPLEVLDRSTSAQSATSPIPSTKEVPSNPKRAR
jgi:hypothetical protein